MPAPEEFYAFFFGITQADRFPQGIDALRPLRLAGIVRSAVHIANDYRVLPSLTQFPWNRAGATGALGGPPLEELKSRLGVLDWHGSGGLYGSKAQVRDARRRVHRALRGLVKRLTFIDDDRLALIQRLRPLLKLLGAHRVDRQLDVLAPAYGLLKGVPTDHFLSAAYWRKRQPMPDSPDPDRDRCGLIWCSVVSETSGEQAAAVQRIARERLLETGFEPGITTTLLSERCLDHVISVVYDREVEGEDRAAKRAFISLLESLLSAGYFPYRLPIFAQGILARADPGYRSVLTHLKTALDPQHLLADGRYTIDEAGQS